MKTNVSEAILDFLEMYGSWGRPATCMEIRTKAPISASISEINKTLQTLIKKGEVCVHDGFYTRTKYSDESMVRRRQDCMLDMKWEKLKNRVKWFRHIPFIDFACASGSISFGNVKETSDFDIVLGIKEGRMFTARYFVGALFSILRARRIDDLQESSPDKLCFNHLITKSTYEKEPHNYYRYALYAHMIPVWVREGAYLEFLQANKWAHMSEYTLLSDRRIHSSPSILRTTLEFLLGGVIGNFIEHYIAKPIAMRRLKKYLEKKGEGGRVVISDVELEFHFILNYERQFENLKI